MNDKEKWGRELAIIKGILILCLMLFIVSCSGGKDKSKESTSELSPPSGTPAYPAPPGLQDTQKSPEEMLAELPPIERTETILNTLAFMLLAYRCHTGAFPTQEQGLEALLVCPPEVAKENWKGPYASTTFLLDSWAAPIDYQWIDEGDILYKLESTGPDGIAGTTDDLTLDDLPRSAPFARRSTIDPFVAKYESKSELESLLGMGNQE